MPKTGRQHNIGTYYERQKAKTYKNKAKKQEKWKKNREYWAHNSAYQTKQAERDKRLGRNKLEDYK
ncbi:MAG: hypothetical protein WC479_09720 [Candidatus Izemoplasmatales bacterium]